MEESGEKIRKGVKRRYKVIGIFILILVVVFAVAIMHGKNQLEKRFEEVRAAGFPVTLAELDAWYSIPEGEENAADIYMQAFEMYAVPASTDGLPVLGDLGNPKRGERLGPETIKLIENYLADNKETLELIREGAKIEHCRYPLDLKKIFSMDYSIPSDMKKCVMLLNLKIMYEAENGSSRTVSEDIEASMALSRSCESAPLQIYQLVRIACLALASESTKYALNRIQLDDDQLTRLIKLFKDAQASDGMYRAIAGERPRLIDYMLDPGKYPSFGGGNSIGIRLYSASGLMDSGLLEYIDITDENLEALRLPPHERRAAVKLVEEKMEDMAWYHTYLKVQGFIPLRICELDLRFIAAIETCFTALAVERYRIANGKLPESLDQVAPRFIESVPLDPFDGKPIRYKKLDKGYVVYSIGEDCVDNGGTERTPENRKEEHDLTFIVERADRD